MPKRSRIGFPTLIAALLLQLASSPSNSDPTATNVPSAAGQTAYIAIIIDDIGHNRIRGERLMDIPADLTFAVIPDTQHATRLARYAHRSGKEVMIHLPMENSHNHPMSTIALTRDLSQPEFSHVFEAALTRVPFAQGVNNHMGSLLTQELQAMSWLMDSVKHHKLYFVDSRTTHKTVAWQVAERKNIRAASRDVFLDNVRTTYDIDQQFRRLLRLAKKNRTAVGIGHPYRSTIEYLTRALPMLEAENVRVISVSEMISFRRAGQQVAVN